MRIIVTIVFSALTFMLVAGCTDNSADDRLRKIVGIPASQPISEALVVEKLGTSLPVGTTESSLAEKIKAAGVGKDALSSYSLIKKRNLAVVRVGLDPNTLGVVKSEWIISFQLDSSQRLQSIAAERYLTGL